MQTLKQIYKNNTNFKNQSKLLLTIDWLTLNIKDNFYNLDFDEDGLFTIENYTLELVENKKTRHFNKFLNVYIEGVKIANILYDSNHPFILKERSHLKFENFTFYTGGVKQYYNDLRRLFSLKDVKVSRLDIACDGVLHHKFLNKFLKTKSKNEISKLPYNRLNDTNNIVPICYDVNDIYSNKYDSFSVGTHGNKQNNTKRSERFIRYYNKTKELIEVSKGKKEYILNYFKENDFKIEKEVYRFEIQLSSQFINKLQEFDVHSIFDNNYLQKIFLSSLIGFYEFRYKDDTNVTRCTPIDFFKGFKQPLFTRLIRVVKDSIRTIKVAIKRQISDTLYGAFKDSHSAKGYIREVTKEQIKKYNLFDWWTIKYPQILLEYQKQCKILGLEYDKGNEYVLSKLY